MGTHPTTGYLDMKLEVNGKDRIIICIPLLDEVGNLINRVMVVEFHNGEAIYLFSSFAM